MRGPRRECVLFVNTREQLDQLGDFSFAEARLEPLLVLLDGAHNVAGAASLVTALREEFPAAPRTLVVGLLRE